MRGEAVGLALAAMPSDELGASNVRGAGAACATDGGELQSYARVGDRLVGRRLSPEGDTNAATEGGGTFITPEQWLAICGAGATRR